MGQIARRRRKSQPLFVSRIKTWLANSPLNARVLRREEHIMPEATSTSRLPTWLGRIWHLPDNVSWMNPLPATHRRGIIVAALIMLLAFLWPTPSPQRQSSSVTPMQSGSPEKEVPLQAEIIDTPPPASSSTSAPLQATAPTAAPEQTLPQPDNQGQWHEYLIASGQTLAQLFRDNNLPVNDVFAMAQVEGSDKPLSTLHAGQTVKIRQNAQGVVTGLTLESGNGDILFTRQPDGTFIKAQ